MRIDELNLMAFGPFTNQCLDFRQGSEGVHVVFGANEAGKSSALRAIRDALFGVPHQSPDNFLHPNKSIRIGFSLRSSDSLVFSAVRRKGNVHTLFDPNNQEPIPDSALAAILAGIDGDSFDRMFGLDREKLLSGGREIAQLHGDVGGILFTAAGGTVRLRQIQESLENKAADIFRPRAQTKALNLAISQFKTLKTQDRDGRRSSREYKQKKEQLDAVQQEAQALAERLRDSRFQESLIDRILKSRRLIESLKINATALSPLADTPALREGFAEDLRKANDSLVTAAARLRGAEEAVVTIDQELHDLAPPIIPPDRWQVASKLSDNLGAFRKAFRDLPGIQRQAKSDRAALEPRLSRLRPDLPLDEYQHLFISAVDRQAVMAIGTRLTTVRALASTTQQDLHTAESECTAAEAALENCPEPTDTHRLDTAMTAATVKGQVEQEHAKLTQRHVAEKEALVVQLRRLGRWSGTLDEIRSLSLPSMVTIETHDEALTNSEDELRRGKEAHKKAVDEQSRLANELDALVSVEGELPTEDDVTRARSLRDGLWRGIRVSWLTKAEEVKEAEAHRVDTHDLAAVGDAYDGLVGDADAVVDRVRREHSRVAQRARLDSDLRAQGRAIETTRQAMSDAQDSLNAATRAWNTVWAALRVVAGAPREMRDWLTGIGAIRTRADGLDELHAEIKLLNDFIATHIRNLRLVLEEVGVAAADEPATLTSLLDTARAFVQKQIQLRQQQVSLEGDRNAARKRADDLSQQLETRRHDLTVVTKEWQAILKKLDVPGNPDTMEADTWMTESMDIYAQAHRLLGPDGSVLRIAHIEADFAAFVSYVTNVGRQLGDAAATPTLATVEDIAADVLEKIEQSKAAARAIDNVKRRRGVAVDELTKQRTDHETCRAKITALEKEAGAGAGADLAELCKRSNDLRLLQREKQKLESDLQVLAEHVPLPEWIVTVEERANEDLPQQLATLKSDIEELESQKTERDQQVGGLTNELQAIGSGTAAVDASLQMQAKLAEIEAHTRDYARLWISSKVLRRAVDAYRERNQGEILRLASEYFAKLTEGAFTGLTIDQSDETPVIAGVRVGHDIPVRVEAMSEGTSHQLFLAMRLAYIDNRAQDHEPMPLILDDVLGSYDDDRAAATLKALAELARKTQVILFTHHKHLLPIAEQSVPGGALFIQELTA
jgi:uncharacterized protein YhaN